MAQAPEDAEPAPREPAKKWHTQLQAAEEREKKWRETGGKIVARYLDERDGYAGGEGCERRVNILWSNTEVLCANLYAKLGKPDVRRTFPQPGAANKIARTTALVLERNLSICSDRYDVDVEIEDSVKDMLLPGRGQAWIDYDPVIEEHVETVDETDEATGAVTQVEKTTETLGYQTVKICTVPWNGWLHGPAKRWTDVPWVAREHLFTREDCAKAWPQFNDDNGRSKIPCNHVLLDGKDKRQEDGLDDFKRAIIYEIWDKGTRSRIYVAKDFDWILESEPDPYRLEGFFPCPKPMYSVKATDNLVPKPEYLQYKDQAEELDRINTRIWKLLESLKYRGVYFAGLDSENALGDLGALEDGDFKALKNLQNLAQGGGLKEAFQVMDLQPIVIAIQGAAERAVQLIQSIYETTGISDVIRGATDKDETATAQSLKARFGSQRLQKRQKDVHRFVRDLYRMKAEIIAEHFERKQLSEAAGIPLPTEQERQAARQLLMQVEQMKKQQEAMAQAQQQAPQGQPPMPPQGAPQPQGMAA